MHPKKLENKMAARSQRTNAGRNVGKLINQEIEGGDDFYSTAYGGFEEESEDEEYESEESEEDNVDSDFDMDETEWGPDDKAEENLKRTEMNQRKKSWIPKPKKYLTPENDQFVPPKPKKVKPKTTLIVTSSVNPNQTIEQRNFRKSTQETSKGFRLRMEEEQMMKRRRTYRRPKKVRKLTQEELLAEAKWTELENIASLEAYTMKIEAEKKKVKNKKVLWSGPVIRYLSITMPMVSEIAEGEGVAATGGDGSVSEPVVSRNSSDETMDASSPPNTDKPVSMETDATKDGEKNSETALNRTTPTHTHDPPAQRQSRNFLVFTDTNNFPAKYFPSSNRPSRPRRKYCPVTGLPAKYIDPLTQTPYATPFAFKIIRMKYVSEAEQKCEKRLVQLSSWLEEKKKKKEESRF